MLYIIITGGELGGGGGQGDGGEGEQGGHHLSISLSLSWPHLSQSLRNVKRGNNRRFVKKITEDCLKHLFSITYHVRPTFELTSYLVCFCWIGTVAQSIFTDSTANRHWSLAPCAGCYIARCSSYLHWPVQWSMYPHLSSASFHKRHKLSTNWCLLLSLSLPDLFSSRSTCSTSSL